MGMSIEQKKKYDMGWFAQAATAACLDVSDERLSELAEIVGAELSRLDVLQGESELDWDLDARGLDFFREDRVEHGLNAEDLLSAAPCRVGDCFAFPTVMGEGGELS